MSEISNNFRPYFLSTIFNDNFERSQLKDLSKMVANQFDRFSFDRIDAMIVMERAKQFDRNAHLSNPR